MPRLLIASLLLLIAGACTCATPGGSGAPTPASAPAPDAEALLLGDEALRARLRRALAEKGPSYVPRTRHKNADGSPKYVNRLILETSPYLLQHAHNPVNWFPWGDEAFAIADKLGRPVFLSVGYSTCHWCHVMEEESFEDEAIARYLNDHYVCIKVDREVRPDVDAVYMKSVELLAGRGGWPMSVWLTPARQPFYAGTYFPPRDGDRGMSKGLSTLLREQWKLYRADPATVAGDALRIAERIRSDFEPPSSGDLPGAATLARAVEIAERRYDEQHGGARGRPKFPSSFPVRLLLRHGLRAERSRSLEMALATLRKMQAGGIYDHVGGGFHRYSVDERWRVPHFEKMLYDNALLAMAYLEGYQASGDLDLARVARETLDYVTRELTAPEGAFYSATDADSLSPSGEREEGRFFTWTPSEIEAALGAERARVVARHYGVTSGGNFEGRNVLFVSKSRDEAARELSLDRAAFDAILSESRELLRRARHRRPKPLLDDKILADYNGLMIAALARGARVLGERRFSEHAARAAAFVLERMIVDGRLRHSFRAGRTGPLAFAADHAFFAVGLLELFQSTGESRHLRAAIARMEELEQHHAREAGGYHRTADDAETLLAREMETRDGAVPAAASQAALLQLQLATLTGEARWRSRAERTLRAFASVLQERPWALGDMLLAVDYLSDSPKEILIALPPGMDRRDAAAAPLLSALAASFVPNQVLVIASDGSRSAGLDQLVPWARDKRAKRDRPTVYVCERGACQLPTSDPVVLRKQLAERRPYPPSE